jgi:hypothetical protein
MMMQDAIWKFRRNSGETSTFKATQCLVPKAEATHWAPPVETLPPTPVGLFCDLEDGGKIFFRNVMLPQHKAAGTRGNCRVDFSQHLV